MSQSSGLTQTSTWGQTLGHRTKASAQTRTLEPEALVAGCPCSGLSRVFLVQRNGVGVSSPFLTPVNQCLSGDEAFCFPMGAKAKERRSGRICSHCVSRHLSSPCQGPRNWRGSSRPDRCSTPPRPSGSPARNPRVPASGNALRHTTGHVTPARVPGNAAILIGPPLHCEVVSSVTMPACSG